MFLIATRTDSFQNQRVEPRRPEPMRRNLCLSVITALAMIFTYSSKCHADIDNIDVYGMLNLTTESVSASGATDNGLTYARRYRIQSNNSHFGIKGAEDLGSDLKGLFQAEVGIDAAMNQYSNGYNFLTLRNTGVGLSGPLGQLLFGLWDTPYRDSTLFVEPFYGTNDGNLSTLIDSIGSLDPTDNSQENTTAASGGGLNQSTFHRRQGNSIQYWSPHWYGLTLKTLYSGNMDRDHNNLSGSNPELFSASLTYEADALITALAYERHEDFRSTNTAIKTSDFGVKAAASYHFENTQLGLIYSFLKYSASSSAGDVTMSRPTYGASLIHKMGNYSLRLGYSLALDRAVTDPNGQIRGEGTGANLTVFGVSYTFSRRTDLFAQFSQIWNKENGSYQFLYNPLRSFGVGADPQAIAIGFRHLF